MFKKGFGYIIFLYIFLIALGSATFSSYIFLQEHKSLDNTYWQYRQIKLAESGINYQTKFPDNIPTTYISGKTTLDQLLKLPAITYTLGSDSFRLLRIQNKIYSIGITKKGQFVFVKDTNLWQQFSE